MFSFFFDGFSRDNKTSKWLTDSETLPFTSQSSCLFRCINLYLLRFKLCLPIPHKFPSNMNLSWSLFTNGFLLTVLYFLFFSDSGAKVVNLDVHEAKNLIQSGHVYLDVRRVQDFQKGHVDADKIINIPYLLDTPKGKVKNPEFLRQVSCACDKEDHIIVGCDCGVKSLYATAELHADGFKDVKNMEGGYRDWVKNRFPVKL